MILFHQKVNSFYMCLNYLIDKRFKFSFLGFILPILGVFSVYFFVSKSQFALYFSFMAIVSPISNVLSLKEELSLVNITSGRLSMFVSIVLRMLVASILVYLVAFSFGYGKHVLAAFTVCLTLVLVEFYWIQGDYVVSLILRSLVPLVSMIIFIVLSNAMMIEDSSFLAIIFSYGFIGVLIFSFLLVRNLGKIQYLSNHSFRSTMGIGFILNALSLLVIGFIWENNQAIVDIAYFLLFERILYGSSIALSRVFRDFLKVSVEARNSVFEHAQKLTPFLIIGCFIALLTSNGLLLNYAILSVLAFVSLIGSIQFLFSFFYKYELTWQVINVLLLVGYFLVTKVSAECDLIYLIKLRSLSFIFLLLITNAVRKKRTILDSIQ